MDENSIDDSLPQPLRKRILESNDVQVIDHNNGKIITLGGDLFAGYTLAGVIVTVIITIIIIVVWIFTSVDFSTMTKRDDALSLNILIISIIFIGSITTLLLRFLEGQATYFQLDDQLLKYLRISKKGISLIKCVELSRITSISFENIILGAGKYKNPGTAVNILTTQDNIAAIATKPLSASEQKTIQDVICQQSARYQPHRPVLPLSPDVISTGNSQLPPPSSSDRDH